MESADRPQPETCSQSAKLRSLIVGQKLVVPPTGFMSVDGRPLDGGVGGVA